QPHTERSVAVPVPGVRYDGAMELTPAHPTEQEALAVRSTVRLEVVHALQDRSVDRAAQTDRAYDPAHGACSSCLGVRIRSLPLRESLGGAPEAPRAPAGVPAPACNDAQSLALLNETQTLRCRNRLPAAE